MDGSPFYVGAGFQVNTSDIVPARVMAGNSSKSGVYVCGNGYEYVDRKSSAQYLIYNDSQVRDKSDNNETLFIEACFIS